MKYLIIYNKRVLVELFNVMILRISIIVLFWFEVFVLIFFILNENVNFYEIGEGRCLGCGV